MKKLFKKLPDVLFYTGLVMILTTCAWHGMNKELCNRNYSKAVYVSMQLVCK